MRKRANGEGNIRKRSNGTWEARVTLGFDSETGKQISKSIYGRTQKEVRDKLAELQLEEVQQADNPLAGPDPSTVAEDSEKEMTLSAWIDEWLENYLADVKYGSYVSYESVTRVHIKPALGDKVLTKLRTPDIQMFYNSLRTKGLSAKTIKNVHGCLHRVLDMAVRVEYISKNPSSLCVLPRVIEKPVTPMDKPEQKRLLDTLKGNPFEALYLTALFTGMRVGEVIGLTWDCVDFEQGTIHITKQLVQARRTGDKTCFGPLKNGKTRIVAPAPYLMEVLKRHKETQSQHIAEIGDLWNPGEFPNLVFTHPDGSHYSQPTIWKELQDILQKAGLAHYRVHDLRHAFAVNSLRAGDDPKTLQDNMGHYSAAFTLDRYCHVTETMRRESANRMQAFIEELG